MRFRKAFAVFVLAGTSVFIFAHQAYATTPAAAELLDGSVNPYSSTGVQVTVSNSGSMYGLATDGTNAYIINSSGNIAVVPLAGIAALSGGSSTTTNATLHTVGWGVSGAPSWPSASNLSMAYSHGCLWFTNSSNTVGSIALYCIDISDYSVTEITVPSDKPLPAGNYYVISSLIDFPDGRVGKVSAEVSGDGAYYSTLRTYTVTGTGKNATITWSHDYIMDDPDYFATDEHGIATDGTYLYRIQWRDHNPNTKVWLLNGDATSTDIVYSGQYTMPFDNMHFLAHNHTANYYLVGHFSNNHFFITKSADPGPGPGNPLTPAFATPTYSSNGFTVQVTNYDSAFTWNITSTAGSASISGSGLVTVSGLSGEGASAIITASTTKSGIPDGGSSLTGTIPDVTAPTLSSIVATPSSASATVTWSTNEAGSTKVVYSTDTNYASSTGESDTGTRLTSHSKALASLSSCTLYNYKVVSADATLNYATSTNKTFTTTGCLGGATPSSATSTTVSVASAATSTATDSGRTLTVATPANFTATSSSVIIQIKGLAADTVLGSIGKPSSSLSSAASLVFDVTALVNDTTVLDSFDTPVTITYHYTDADISGIDENSLSMYHYHDGEWLVLSDCSVNASANTITCDAPSFSTFAIFGNPVSSSNSSSANATLPWCSGPNAPGWKVGLADGGCGAQSSGASVKISSCPAYAFTRTLKYGMTGEDVRALQKLMNCLGFTLGSSGPGSPGHETNLFVSRTFAAVAKFQDTYAQDILAPLSLANGTGIFAELSRKTAARLTQ